MARTIPSRFACMLLLVTGTVVHAANHAFKQGDKIPFYVNKVGPYFNTHETYHYYSLPVCRPEKIVHRSLTLGEVLDGDRMAESLYSLKFRENLKTTTLCEVELNEGDIRTLRDAIEEMYFFEFVIDDLPVRGFIGQLEEKVLPHNHRVFLWTHKHFLLEYNGKNVVGITVNEKSKEIELPVPEKGMKPIKVTHTYSASWVENKDVTLKTRGHHGKKFFPTTLEIHWLSIINSVVLCLLLCGFVAIIVARIVSKDFARYTREDEDLELDSEIQDDQGWKIIYTDVFRFPQYKSLLCSILGNGMQFVTLATCIIAMALSGMFNVHRHGSMNTAAVMIYAVTCGVAGFVSSRFYKRINGQNWVWNIVLTASIFAVPFFVMWSIVNSVAWYVGSTQALPATTIVILLLIWIVIGFTFTVIGGILGKNTNDGFDAPCRTKNIAREIPPVAWYRSAVVHLFIGGFLPFSSISVELYYIFTTLWGRDHYTLYGILMIVFLILITVTICISVALTYFQLSSEDYRWWWRSVFAAGSTGAFVFGYGVFYFSVRSQMSGVLQTVQFFGYTLLACYAFFLMLGTIGFFSSMIFVRYIYQNLKLD